MAIESKKKTKFFIVPPPVFIFSLVLFFFAESGDVMHMVLPRQAVCLLYQALDRLKGNYERLEEMRVAGASSYAVLTENHKKRRTEAV